MDNIHTISFTDNFIEKIAGRIVSQYLNKGKSLERLAVVFGGKRPAMFLKRQLAKELSKEFLSPKFFTINEFMGYIVKKNEPFGSTKDLDSNYLLYLLAKKTAPEILKGRESFARFLPWTQEILAFLDQMDLEDVQEKDLLNLRDNAQIGYPVPPDINRLLKHIVQLRTAYHQQLKKQKTYSRGLQYLRAAQLIGQVDFKEFDEIWFCNFFYFNRCEEKVVRKLFQSGQVRLYFQGDDRKWNVLNDIAKKFQCPIREGVQIRQPQFDLKLFEGFDIHSQVCLVRNILEQIKSQPGFQLKDYGDTVIVLPNPDLLIPLLSEIADDIQDFNISMGYPLKRSSLFTLCESVFKAQLSKRDNQYYAKDYLKVIRHPFVKNLKFTEESGAMRVLIHKIEEILVGKEPTELSGQLFLDLSDIAAHDKLFLRTQETLKRMGIAVSRKKLSEFLEHIHQVFFLNWEPVRNFNQFSAVLKDLLDLVIHKSFMKRFPLNLNIAQKMLAINEEFQNARFQHEQFPQEELYRIFKAKIEGEMIAFQGSPLKGMQILGLFETRSLNFKNVVVVDASEGTLPRLNLYQPLIPREVMLSLKLDRLELEEEIQRYQFMRLISSAKNVFLVFQSGRDKERSRFVEELLWEEEKKSGKIDNDRAVKAGFLAQSNTENLTVKKTQQMVEFLRNFRYSASSINTYLRNPLDFYYQYVLGLAQKEDLLDEPEARHIGTFIHELLEEGFRPFLNKRPDFKSSFYTRFNRIFEERFEKTFGKGMKSDSFLLKSVIMERLTQFLKSEQSQKNRKVQEILYLENRFEDVVKLDCGEFRFRYIVDRVDRLEDGTVMIIDYKTGSTDQMPSGLDSLKEMEFSRESIRDEVRSFQIPLYFHYLNKQFKDQPIDAALYNLRTCELKKFLGGKNLPQRHEIDGFFINALNFVLNEILDPQTPFVEDKTSFQY